MKQDLHCHTIYADGRNTPEEMILSAIDKGFDRIGISEHSFIPDSPEGYCLKEDKILAYRAEMEALKFRYRGKIDVKCGVEMDILSTDSAEFYDYCIGSVHYVEANGVKYAFDDDAETLKAAADLIFGGDMYSLCEYYFEQVSHVVEKTKCDIIGHFNLVCKLNEKNGLFDENHPRYVAAWKKAADRLIPFGVPFEINTGAITRGYKTVPYPSDEMIKYISEKGGKFILSSDSHSAETLGYGFEELSRKNVVFTDIFPEES